MAPLKPSKLAAPSTSQASSSNVNSKDKQRPKHKVHKSIQNANPNPVPGVQKVKSALRQTRRLLAKDNLAADVRVNTERRLKALEAELIEAERVRKERTIAQRYHKVKFFERQKVTRRLNQVKRQLEECTEKKERKKLEKSLKELRVDLNYILNYPKLKKYISIFPPEVRQRSEGEEASTKGVEEDSPQDTSTTDAQRKEIRQEIRDRMDRGELSAEPELEDHHIRTVKPRQDPNPSSIKDAKSHSNTGPKRVPEVQEDAFFGEESDGEADDDDVNMDES